MVTDIVCFRPTRACGCASGWRGFLFPLPTGYFRHQSVRFVEHLRVHARKLIRGLLPVVAAGAAVTCDAPTRPARHMVALAVQPVLRIAVGAFGGLSVDSARLIVVRPPADTVAAKSFYFPADSTQIAARVSVPVSDTASFWVTIQLLSGSTQMFCGTDTVVATVGVPVGNPAPVVLQYCGPGTNVAAIQIAPRDSGVSFGGSLQYRITAVDSAAHPVTQFYAGWSAGTGNTINADGLFRAGKTRGTGWVYAHTPTGIRDSTRVTVSPVANQIVVVSGNNQTGVVGTVLPQPLVVRVLAADNLPVGGITVQFSASGGGTANPPSAVTDSLGLAQTAVTLGSTAGSLSITASVAAATQVQFAATATQQAGVPASLTKVAGDGQSAPVGTAVATAPQVKVTDAFSTPVSGVSVTFAVASGGGSVTGATATTNSSGLASVGSWTLGPTAGSNSLTATVPTLGGVTFTATGTAVVLPAIVLTVPGNLVGVGGQGLALVKLTQPAPAGGVTVTVTSDSTSYLTVASPGTIAFAAGDTLKSITLTGVASGVSILHATASGYTAGITAVGVTPNLILLQAPFSLAVGQSTSLSIQLVPAASTPGFVVTLASTDTTKLKITTPTVTFAAAQSTGSATVHAVAAGVVGVTATATGYAPGGTAVTVTSGTLPAAILALVSGNNQSGVPGVQLPLPIVVKAEDTTGTGVSGVAVTFATTDGSVATPNATTDANGLASTTWTLSGSLNAQHMTATATGLIGSPLTITANGSAIVSTTVAPKRDTLTAINGTFTLVAQAKDALGNNLPGSYTWVSRKPSAVTVNLLGVVKAVTNNDSSWVVATESGGTKDSALIVVQQKLASINVTPATRSLYLTTSFNFTATAVDGLGTPLPSNPAFTWSTTAPAVATVDGTGHVVGVGLGAAQIKATSGTVTGVANVSVITAITRIAVVVDTVGAAKTDTFSMPSLGLSRRYRAIAHDTLDAVMTGLAFTWASTNGSVAVMNSTAGDTASAISAANGVTKINAAAQGFTSAPGAALTVSQVLASIELKPDTTNPTATIGLAGTMHVSARGKDANNRYISGGTFTYASATPAVATVDAVTGVVTGVALGTTSITATSGAITSNTVTVTVANTGVPAIISFGRDTVSVGRGSSASIPILLSKPNAAPLIVKLVVADTFAYWSTAAVTIPAGQTSVNATLNGHNAGTTTVTASDSSGLGYSSGSAVAKVTANMRLTSSGYAINATDIVTTQVLLSDPSPAGGTFVTFSYSTPGIAATSPDPAFIPAGQLAADIQIRGLAAGSTNVTPSAIGVNGTASSFTVYAPVLTPSNTLILLGQGQYQPNVYVYTPTYTNLPVPVTITSSDSTTVSVTPSVTIPANSYYAYFTTTANVLGSATLTLSATGWTASNTIHVVATTPYLGLCCGGTYNTTSPQTSVTVYSEDSTRSSHYRVNSLVVHLTSRDPTVMRVIDTVVTINPGAYYTSGRVIPGGLGGTTWIVATASGHQPDSTQYTVVGPKLQFSFSQNYVGTGQYDPNQYVYTPDYVTAPLIVSVANSNPTSVTVPSADTIPTSSYYRYFNVVGNALGTATFIASATGYQPDTATYTVTSPRLTACCNYTFNNFGPGSNVTVYTTDSLRNGHYRTAPLSVTVVSTDPTVVTVDSTVVTVDSGTYYNTRARLTPVGVGTAKIIFSATGHLTLDTLTITVQTPKVQFSFYSELLGRRQHFNPAGNGFYVYTPDYRPSPLAVTITQQHASVDSLSTTAVTVPTSSYYAYLDAFGLAYGTDTLIVSAPGYLPDTAFVTVTTPRLTSSNLPSATTTTNPPIGITVYTTDSVGSGHYASDTVVVAAVSSDSTVIRPVQPFFRILKNAYYTSTSVNVVGPGTANITYSDSAATGYLPTTTNTITVTGPALAISNGTTVLGMRQTGGTNSAYVYTPNNVATPLVVNLVSSDPRVVSVPASVTVPSGSYYAYFQATALDTVGTIQIQATATGYSAASTNVQVTQPKFVVSTSAQLNTTSAAQTIYVYAADANGSTHYTTENVTATLASSAPSVATIDSGTVTIPSGSYYVNTPKWSPGLVGTAQLSATDTRPSLYKYNTGTVNVAVVTPTLYIYNAPSALGLGQYQDNAYVQAPDYQTADLAVTFTHTGAARVGTYTNQTNTPITGLTIPQNQYYTYFRMAGLVRGTDTLTASATSPAHNPSTIYTVVDSGRVDPIGGWPGSITAGDSVLVTLYARDLNTTTHYVVAATQFTLAPNSNIEFHLAGATVTTVTIPANAYYVQFYLVGKAAGSGSVTITNADYKTYSTTVTVQ